MRLCITTEEHYLRTPEGRMWTVAGNGCVHFQHYLGAFEEVCVVARVRDVAAPSDWRRVDGDGVSVAAVPDYTGPLEYLRARRQVMQAIQAAAGERDDVVLRVGAQSAACLQSCLAEDKPSGLEG